MLEVLDGGIQTTVQDMGRRGGQALGIPPSGAQDGFALRIANLLVDNPPGGPLVLRADPGAAGLEIVLGRLKLRATEDHAVALAGADLNATVDGAPVPPWSSFLLRSGAVLACAMARRGARGYLAVHGGIDVPLWLGSRATYVRGNFGGFEGRPLRRGDRLPVGAPTADMRTEPGAPDWYHPGRAGTFKLGPRTVLAHFGEIHPGILDDLDVQGPLAMFEAFLDAAPEAKGRKRRARPRLDAVDLPAVERDFAFLVGSEVPAGDVVRAAASADKDLIVDVSVFDVFEGDSLGAGRKSLAIGVRLQPRERTLTEAEIDAVSAGIVTAVEEATGGRLRR